MEKTNMEALDNVLSDVPAVKQTNAKDENKEVTNVFQKSASMLQEARDNGTAVWQGVDKESLKRIHYPEVIGKNKEGNDFHYAPATVNVLMALQEQKNRNTHDFRWMRLQDAIKAKDISVAQGTKSVDFVFYTKVKPEDREKGVKPTAYTVKMVNLSDLSGKGVPKQIEVHDHTRDMFARDMVFYMSRREANNTLSIETPKDYTRIISGAIGFSEESKVNRDKWAKEQAEERAKAKAAGQSEKEADKKAVEKVENPERAAMKEESAKRLDAILKADVSKAKTPAEKFVCFMKEGYEKNPRNYVTFAVEKAQKELNFAENHVKNAITKFAPGAAFDGSVMANGAKKEPYADRVVANMKKAQQKTNGASR